MEKFDLIIIGGGRASNLAVSAAKKVEKVAIIEKSILGGTCPNRGCIPSKLLIGHAHVARTIRDSQRHFIDSEIKSIDLEKIFETNNEFLAGVEANSKKRFPEGVTIFEGTGSFVAEKEVQVNGTTLTADKIVIATGGRPRKTLHEKAWTSDDIFPLKGKIPKSVTIVGAGFIGVELANFFSGIGVHTTLVSNSTELLNREDEEIRAIFKEEFIKHVDVKFETKLSQIDFTDNVFNIEFEGVDGAKTMHKTDALIEATGRIPNTDNLKLENTSITLNKFGYVERNEFCETNVKGVYAVGDVSSKFALQHIATHEVAYLTNHLYENENKPLTYKYVPHAVFTDPEIASVGITEQEAKAQGLKYVTATTGWSSAKALSMRLKYPRTKFIVNPDTYEILGCHLIGPESSTMIHQVLAVMHIDNDIRHLRSMMHVHPALNEVILAGAAQVITKINS